MPRGKQNTPSEDNGKERPQVGKRTTRSRKGAASHQSEGKSSRGTTPSPLYSQFNPDEQRETPMETEDAELHPLPKKQGMAERSPSTVRRLTCA